MCLLVILKFGDIYIKFEFDGVGVGDFDCYVEIVEWGWVVVEVMSGRLVEFLVD